MGIRKLELPAIHESSSLEAANRQRLHFMVVKLELWFAILGATTGTLAGAGVIPVPAAVLSAVFFAVSLVAALISRTRAFERGWFNARAVAESSKTLAWRYGLGIAPFGLDHPPERVDRELLDALEKVRRERPEIEPLLARFEDTGPTITPSMKELRTLPLTEQMLVYQKLRLEDQVGWYRSKAKRNAHDEEHWFWTLGAMQLVGIAAAVLTAACWQYLPFSPVPIIAAAAAAIVAWSRAKRFVDLSQAYSVTSQELNKLVELAPSPATDRDSFEKWVSEVEEAISREHTMWRAKRAI